MHLKATRFNKWYLGFFKITSRRRRKREIERESEVIREKERTKKKRRKRERERERDMETWGKNELEAATLFYFIFMFNRKMTWIFPVMAGCPSSPIRHVASFGRFLTRVWSWVRVRVDGIGVRVSHSLSEGILSLLPSGNSEITVLSSPFSHCQTRSMGEKRKPPRVVLEYSIEVGLLMECVGHFFSINQNKERKC